MPAKMSRAKKRNLEMRRRQRRPAIKAGLTRYQWDRNGKLRPIR